MGDRNRLNTHRRRLWSLNEDNGFWNTLQNDLKINTRIRGHALRHIGATSMADSGVEEEVAMALLGHESTAMSFYYWRMTARKQSSQVTNLRIGMDTKHHLRGHISPLELMKQQVGSVSIPLICSDVYRPPHLMTRIQLSVAAANRYR